MGNQSYYGDPYNQGDFNWTTKFGKKPKTEGQRLEESGQYLKDPETEVDTSQPLQSKSFEIDPSKKPLTEAQKRLQEKLRKRAGTGQQGADLAREKLEKKGGSATDLPQFLQVHKEADPIIKEGIAEDMAENAAKDKAIKASGKAWEKGNLTARERIEQLLNAPNAAQRVKEVTGAEGYNRQRQLGIDSAAQKVREVTGSKTAGSIVGFLTDVGVPTAEDLALSGAIAALATPAVGGVSLAALRMKKFGNEAVDFFMKAKNVISHQRGGRVGALVDGQVIDRANLSKIFMDDQLARQSAQPMRMTLDPKGLRDWGRNKRIAGAKFITGNNIQKEDAFIQAGWKVLVDLNKRFGIDINRAVSPFQVHHKGVVRQIAESANGLTDESAKIAGDYISKRVGFKLGYDPSNASPLPAKFHQRVHDIINDVISSGMGDNLKGLEKKLNLPTNWQTTMDLQARIDAGIYDEIADAINKHTDTIDKFWNSVATRTNLGKLSRDQYIEATLEVVEQDEILKKLRRTRNPSPETGYTITNAVNELLERAGRVDLQSPIFQKLTPDFAEDAYKFALQKDGEKALIEALTTGQDSTAIFKAYGLKTKGFHKLFRQLELPGFTGSKPKGPRGRPEGSKTDPRKLQKQRQKKFDKDPDLNPKNPDIDETKPIDAPDD